MKLCPKNKLSINDLPQMPPDDQRQQTTIVIETEAQKNADPLNTQVQLHTWKYLDERQCGMP